MDLNIHNQIESNFICIFLCLIENVFNSFITEFACCMEIIGKKNFNENFKMKNFCFKSIFDFDQKSPKLFVSCVIFYNIIQSMTWNMLSIVFFWNSHCWPCGLCWENFWLPKKQALYATVDNQCVKFFKNLVFFKIFLLWKMKMHYYNTSRLLTNIFLSHSHCNCKKKVSKNLFMEMIFFTII